jgi:hypothetical protein
MNKNFPSCTREALARCGWSLYVSLLGTEPDRLPLQNTTNSRLLFQLGVHHDF